MVKQLVHGWSFFQVQSYIFPSILHYVNYGGLYLHFCPLFYDGWSFLQVQSCLHLLKPLFGYNNVANLHIMSTNQDCSCIFVQLPKWRRTLLDFLSSCRSGGGLYLIFCPVAVMAEDSTWFFVQPLKWRRTLPDFLSSHRNGGGLYLIFCPAAEVAEDSTWFFVQSL